MRPALSVLVLYFIMGAYPVSPLFRIHPCTHLGMGGLGTRRSTCLVRTCWRYGTIHANSMSSSRAFPGSEPHCYSGKMALGAHSNQGCRPTTDVPTKPIEHVSTVTDNELDDEVDTSRKLYDVVTQLQGDIREGSSQDAKMRKAIDNFFERLPDPSQSFRDPTKASVPLAYEGPSSTSTSNRINIEESEKRSNSPSDFGNTRMTICSNSSIQSGTEEEGGKPLPMLLTRRQDVPPQSSAGVNNMNLNKLGETQFLSTLTATKFQIMRTRLESIRKGRVSWAVLPLLLRARDSGITMTTAIYNSALEVYKATPNKYPDAIRVLEIMRSLESLYGRPDVTSYNIVMRVCGDAGNWRTVFELLDQMRAEGIVPDADSRAVILNGVAKAKRWRHAHRLFTDMTREGLPINEVGYNAMVEAAGLGSPSPHRHMVQFVCEMEQAGKMPTKYTYTVLLHCLALRRRFHGGFLVMVRLLDARVPLLPLGYHAALTFCKEHGDWRRAMALMEDMRVTNRRPSGEMYLLAVQACAKGGQWERALSLMVERRRNDAKEAAQVREAQAAAARADVKINSGSRPRPVGQARAEELDMRSFEAVLEAVSLAGQFEVALRLLHQIRSARYTPSEACYMAAIRAAAKWGRWDHVDGLLHDVEKLGVEAPVPKGRRGKTPKRQGPDATVRRELGSECYAYLVQAYAQAMLWTHAIDVYREKLLPRWNGDGKEPLTYEVYAGVLEACMATSDGVTALQVIRRQVLEARGVSKGERSGGPPDRRCWCLAAEALGRAGMIDEGHALLRAMVLAGMPVRESTKADVPSLMPLPGPDGFDWRRRRLRRSRRSRSRAQPGRRRDVDAALRQFVQSVPDLAGDARNGTAVDNRDGGKLFRNSGKGEQVGLGEVLMRDWEQKRHFMAEYRISGDTSRRLERKRKRMEQFSSRDERREEGRQQLLPKMRLEQNALPRGSITVQGDAAKNRTPRLGGREAFPVDSALERLRGRDGSFTLRMYFPRSPGILERRNRTREQDRVALGRQENPSCGGKV